VAGNSTERQKDKPRRWLVNHLGIACRGILVFSEMLGAGVILRRGTPFYRGLLGIGFTMSSFVSKLLSKDTTMLETAQNNPEITKANPRVTPINPRQKQSCAKFQKRFLRTTDKPCLIHVSIPPSTTTA
jgi:hypothetical protein